MYRIYVCIPTEIAHKRQLISDPPSKIKLSYVVSFILSSLILFGHIMN